MRGYGKAAIWLGLALAVAGLGATLMYPHPSIDPLTSAILGWVCFLVAAPMFAYSLIFFGIARGLEMADRQKVIPSPPPESQSKELPPPALPPVKPHVVAPPTIEYITCESNVALIHVSKYRYSRLPAQGDLTYGAVAAFRNKHGPNAILTAHMRVGNVHVHSGAWVGSSDGSYTLGAAQTAELILAVHSVYGYYYLLDVGSDGLTHKTIPYGTYAAEVELDVRGAPSMHFSFDLALTLPRDKMSVVRVMPPS